METKSRISRRTIVPLMKAERPYEDFCIGWFTILRMGSEWRMWYEAYDHNYRDDADCMLCYAVSKDGVLWKRPNLSICEYGGNRDNNTVLVGKQMGPGGMHGSTVFLDEAAPENERIKMVFARKTLSPAGLEWWVHGATSPDGLKWSIIEEPLLRKNSDTQTVCFRDGDLYRLYVRMWSKGVFGGCRMVGYSESPWFGSFPDPVVVMRPGKEDPPNLQFYSSATAKLSNEQYIMFPSGYYLGEDITRVHIALSRDGKTFRRIGRGPVLDLGEGFDNKGMYVSPGVFETGKPGKYWVYYNGVSANHDQNVPAKVKYGGGIGRFLLEIMT
jgi:hypothetical protein